MKEGGTEEEIATRHFARGAMTRQSKKSQLMTPKPNNEGRLQATEMYEESSLESTLYSSEEDSEEFDDSDIDSISSFQSGGRSLGWEDEGSTESPLLSVDHIDELSDTLEEEEDAITDSRSMEGLTYVGKFDSSLSSMPLTKISEHTRETSTSCRTNSNIYETDSFSFHLSTPSRRARNRIILSNPLRSPQRMHHPSGFCGKSPCVSVIEWDERVLKGSRQEMLEIIKVDEGDEGARKDMSNEPHG